MRRSLLMVMLLTGSLLIAAGAVGSSDSSPSRVADDASVHFEAIEVYLDSGDIPLAAYQFELSAAAGDMKIVGIENGGHPAFTNPPRYDRQAAEAGRSDRIIIADFSTNEPDTLPTGKTRLATIHVQITSDADFEIKLQAAADADGKKFQPNLTYRKGSDR